MPSGTPTRLVSSSPSSDLAISRLAIVSGSIIVSNRQITRSRDRKMDFRKEAHALVDWIADYLETIESRRIVPDVKPGDVSRQLPATAPEQGESFDRIFSDFERVIMPGLVQWQHPNWFAYFASNNSPASLLGEMLSSALGVHAMSWVTSPAATELEQVTVEWMRRLLGFPDHLRGVIQDTASSATLAAVIAGRDQAWQRVGRDADIVFYASDEAHSSVAKAARLAGFGPDQVRSVATDDNLAMRPDALEALVRADLAAGRVPAVVVVTVGSTSSAAVDPVRAVGEIARRHGLFITWTRHGPGPRRSSLSDGVRSMGSSWPTAW
jgi:aromatic-L-amino-acid decarboxylase